LSTGTRDFDAKFLCCHPGTAARLRVGGDPAVDRGLIERSRLTPKHRPAV